VRGLRATCGPAADAVVAAAVAEDEEAAVAVRAAAGVPPVVEAALLAAVAELHALAVHRAVPLHAHLPCRGRRRPPSDVQVEVAVRAWRITVRRWATCPAQAIARAPAPGIAQAAGTSLIGQRRDPALVHAPAQAI
jgi:hypothetical protein